MAYALSVWAGWIAWTDWRTRRISNVSLILVLAPLLVSLVWLRHGLLAVGVTDALLGLSAATAVTLPGYVMGYLGAGDVKYAGVLGLLLGAIATLKMLLVFALLLGAFSAATFWWHHADDRPLQRRIAAAPALTLGFLIQLFLHPLTDWLTR